ncbi:unnamed protein product [Ilex paraguariensis]|uniref:Uncharacterized protein n=1 Tax=Ilex paraguariensis TaxID=185542 RepID=A0ABC8RDW1_9AQUA
MVSQGLVNGRVTTKPPIKIPSRKVENCNQVVKIGKFSWVNIAGNDIVPGNKKLVWYGVHFTANILETVGATYIISTAMKLGCSMFLLP